MYYNIGHIILELQTFLRNKDATPHLDQSWANKIGQLFSLLTIDIPIMLMLSVFIGALEQSGLIHIDEHKLKAMMESYPLWQIVLLTVAIMPLVEEIVFRLWLKPHRHYIMFFFLTLSIALLWVIVRSNPFEIKSIPWIVALPSLLLLGIGFVMMEKVGPHLEKLWTRRFGFLVGFSIILFGFVHLGNYTLTTEIILFSPIIILPQIVIGFFLTYLRVRFGLIWGYFMHALHNGLFLSIALLEKG